MTDARWHPASTEASATRAVELFGAGYGGAPAGVWSAPGRVNLIGEHVDYAGGVCLPYALPHRTFAAVRPRTDGRLGVVSAELDEPWTGALDTIGPGAPRGWAAYPAGTAWALRAAGAIPPDWPGADVAVHSDLPLGAGLSSSAALECAVGVALLELFGDGAGEPGSAARDVLARAGVRAENEIVGASTGGMDQAVAVHARAGHCLRLDCLTFEAVPVPLAVAAAGLTLLVIDTNAPHRLVDGQYAARRAAVDRASTLLGTTALGRCESVDAALAGLSAAGADDPVLARRVRHVITDSARARASAELLAAGRVAELGPLLSAAHASLRDDYEISCPESDSAVDAAEAAGALGARQVGGGFGGSVVALTPVGAVDAVVEAVRAAAAGAGLTEPSFLRGEPSAAAGRS